MKYIISVVSTLALVLAISPVANSQFTDVSSQNEFNSAIMNLQESGIVEGYSDPSSSSGQAEFRPDSTINRAELLKIALETKFESSQIAGSNCFDDVAEQWFAKYVCFAKQQNIVDGYDDGSFKPERNINFAELSKILANVYEIDPESFGNEWFRGYVTAMGSAKAIPSSVTSFDKQVTRGEMAEMMYRIKEGVNTKPSKTYFSIKHPKVAFDESNKGVQYVETCEDLNAVVSEFSQQNSMVMYAEDAAVAPMAMPMATTNANRVGGEAKQDTDSSFSETNVQVEGIDEGDIVKTDGEYIYALRNNVLTITRVQGNGSMQIITEHKLAEQSDTDQFYANELYLDNGFIVLVGQGTEAPEVDPPKPIDSANSARMIAPDYYWPSYQQFAEVRLYRMAGETVELERTVSIKGNSLSTRLKDGRLYLVSSDGPQYWYPMPLSAEASAGVPVFKDTASSTELRDAVPCNRVAILPQYRQSRYITTTVIPVDASTPVNHDTILASGDTVYMSHNNLYVAGQEWNYGWGRAVNSKQTTNVYRFAVQNDGIEYQATGSVPGRIINQFAMDEYEQGFRIATTIDQSFGAVPLMQPGMEAQMNKSTNNLFVLNFAMQTVGEITNIAPGETIYSVRFMGDRTYMVTFKKVDPFFVIDTSDPRNPTILGQLKLPGYSDYLHPYDENHIIGFGKEAVAAKDEDFAWYQGMKVALFDVSDVTNPTLKDSATIGDRGTSSELLYNHKALLFEKDRNLMAFPIAIHTLTEEQKQDNNEGNAWGEQTFQGAIVYTVNENGFSERGKVTHYTQDDMLKLGSHYYGKNIERIIRIGQSLYTIGQTGIQAHDETTLNTQGAVEFKAVEDMYRIEY